MRGQVAAMVGPERIALKEFEIPEPEPGAVVLEVTRANVCGSDVPVLTRTGRRKGLRIEIPQSQDGLF